MSPDVGLCPPIAMITVASVCCSVSEDIPFETAGLVRSGRVFCGVYGVGFRTPFVTEQEGAQLRRFWQVPGPGLGPGASATHVAPWPLRCDDL